MQTQKICDDFYQHGDEDDENRGPVIGHLTCRALNTIHELYRGSNQIGRGTQNDIVVDHATVSDVHAEIDMRESNDAIVKDLRSSNGTFVERVSQSNDYVSLQLLKGQTQLLSGGCAIRFGG